jgi:PTH1 family peptidyl-tRNA hydrolase
MSDTKLVIGLGNPGREYVDTRHNMGFKVIDSLAEVLKIGLGKRKFGARFGTGEFANKKLILLEPLRFMNRSGGPTARAANFYKLEASDLLVVTDDMALALGRLRIRARGSSGGHNGLTDVLEKLGTQDVPRLRIGIGQSDRDDWADFVLAEPPKSECLIMNEAIARAREAVLCWIENDVETTMNRFN